MASQGNGKSHSALEEQDNGAVDTPVPSYSMLPGSVRHIVAVELCERFSFYGMRAILALYLSEAIGLSENGATEGIHLFIVAAYISPLLGAFISDSYLVSAPFRNPGIIPSLSFESWPLPQLPQLAVTGQENSIYSYL